MVGQSLYSCISPSERCQALKKQDRSSTRLIAEAGSKKPHITRLFLLSKTAATFGGNLIEGTG
jgi:hypothetical protein